MILNAKFGMRPLACGVYGGLRPEGNSGKRHRAKNPGPVDQAFNIGVIRSDLRKNFIFMNFFIKGLAVYPQNI